MTRTFQREDLAWVAGFFDGEGYAGITKQKAYRHPRVSVSQKRPEPLLKIKRIMGFGTINGPYLGGPNRDRISYRYQVSSFEHAQAFGALIWTWLGSAKRNQFKSIMQRQWRPQFISTDGPCRLCEKRRFAKGLCSEH
jgi:hypothetical protein